MEAGVLRPKTVKPDDLVSSQNRHLVGVEGRCEMPTGSKYVVRMVEMEFGGEYWGAPRHIEHAFGSEHLAEALVSTLNSRRDQKQGVPVNISSLRKDPRVEAPVSTDHQARLEQAEARGDCLFVLVLMAGWGTWAAVLAAASEVAQHRCQEEFRFSRMTMTELALSMGTAVAHYAKEK